MTPAPDKQPKRFVVEPQITPGGSYNPGIASKDMGAHVGYVLTIWPHVEERMIGLFAFLAGIEHSEDARIIFRTIVAQKGRIDLMLGMLEKSPHNVDLSGEYDKIINEFQALNGKRNTYAHGLWWTHVQTKDTYLEEKTATSGLIFLKARKVTHDELDETFNRMMELVKRLQEPSLYRR